MDTYGDLVTLLLTFFVLLFAFSSVDQAKWNSLVQAFTGMPPKTKITAIDLLSMPDFETGMGGMLTELPESEMDEDAVVSPEDMVMIPASMLESMNITVSDDLKTLMGSEEYQEVERNFSSLYGELTSYIEANGLQDMLFAERDVDSIYLRVTTGILFESGNAKLKEEAIPILDTLETLFCDALGSISVINIEGHTDNRPINNAKFEDNWDLSAKRATNVVRFMTKDATIPYEYFTASGYGEYRPVASNDTEEGRQQNRRVQFVLRKKIITIEDVKKDEEQ